MYILGIDSSTGQVSIAVSSDRQLLSRIEYGKSQKNMVSIISLIDKALKKADISLDFVDLFAVNIGPGDFTGTRIGISVAKTLAWVKNKPICGIGSLNITAIGIFLKNFKKIQKPLGEGKQIIITPVLDVKKNEVFFAFFKVEESNLGIAVDGKNYSVNKFSDGCLVGSKDFIKKFSDLFFPDCSFSSFILLGGSGFSSYKHLESEVKELGCLNSGLHPGSPAGANKYPGVNIFMDKKVLYPDAFHLNLCAYYSYLKNRQEGLKKIKNTGQGNHGTSDYDPDDYGLAPLYVREFTPFKT